MIANRYDITGKDKIATFKEDPVGKKIKMNVQESYSVDGSFMVTGVFKNLPANATIAPVNGSGKDLNDKIFIHSNAVSPEYLSTMHMQLVSGRDFYSDGRSVNKEIIINESLAKIMDKEGQPGGMLQVDTTHLQVAGVIKDFVYNDMYGASMPALFVCT